MASVSTLAQEPLAKHHHHHLLCWKSIFGGLTIALMAFAVLTALGTGLAGLRAESLISKEEGSSAFATMSGLWLGLSCVIALFCGSYFCLRVSRFVTNRVGAAHGFVIASLFFGLVLTGAGNVIGGVAQGLGKGVSMTAAGGADLASNPAVEDAIQQSLGTTATKADPKTFAHGLVTRVLSGDTEGAKNYFAYQTGMSREDVDAKITQLKANFDEKAKQAAEASARATADTGLLLFLVLLVGLISAMVGGRFGAHENITRPFARNTETI